jgi:hypothetical protein
MDSNDFALLMPVGGGLTRAQLGRDLEVNAGDAVGILHNEPASLRFHKLEHVVVMVPKAAMSPIVDNLEEASTRLVPRGTEAVRLLTGYLMTLFGDLGMADPSLCKLVATHIYDLVAMAIGATREGLEVALSRGVRAARLNAIKADFDRNPASTLTAIARTSAGHAALCANAVRRKRHDLFGIRTQPAPCPRASAAGRPAPCKLDHQRHSVRGGVRRSLPLQPVVPPALRRLSLGDESRGAAFLTPRFIDR